MILIKSTNIIERSYLVYGKYFLMFYKNIFLPELLLVWALINSSNIEYDTIFPILILK